MFIFWRLLLAHFIADFPLQFNFLYRLKTKYFWGSFIHSGIFILIAIFLLWPVLNNLGLCVFLLFLFLIHGFQDAIKINYSQKYQKDTVGTFLWEQVLHFIAMSLVFLTPLSLLKYQPAAGNIWHIFYNDDKLIIYLISFVAIGFGGTILIPYVEKSVKHTKVVEIPPKWKYYGVMERMLIIGLLVVPGYYFLLVPLVWLVRWFSREETSKTAALVSLIIATLVGIILRVYI